MYYSSSPKGLVLVSWLRKTCQQGQHNEMDREQIWGCSIPSQFHSIAPPQEPASAHVVSLSRPFRRHVTQSGPRLLKAGHYYSIQKVLWKSAAFITNCGLNFCAILRYTSLYWPKGDALITNCDLNFCAIFKAAPENLHQVTPVILISTSRNGVSKTILHTMPLMWYKKPYCLERSAKAMESAGTIHYHVQQTNWPWPWHNKWILKWSL